LTGESTKGCALQEQLGIAGSGAIACGLAVTAAARGEVVVWARSDASADRARDEIASGCAKLDGDEGVTRNVRIETDLAALSDSTFVVESVAEDLEVKADVLRDLGGLIDDGAVLATTTSSLPVADLARASGRPRRFAAVHVFNPVPRMELVELCFPSQADEETRRRARALCEALGKKAVEVPDTPGFVVNRLLFPYLFEAVELIQRTGLDPQAIDACMTGGAGHPMGPLRLLDLVGIDVAVSIGDAIDVPVPRRLRQMLTLGELGRKTRRGFYDYD
jgi:3-hydroxybutyryl-CoA dehydrogenase